MILSKSKIGKRLGQAFVLVICAFNISGCDDIGKVNVSGSVSGPGGSSSVSFPGITSISNVAATSIQLNWTSTAGAASYQIFNTTSGSPVYVGTVTAPASNYSVTGLTPATTYKYRVKLVDTVGLSDSNTTDLSTTTLSIIATFQGWSNAQALGARTPAAQATDLTSAAAQVTLNWNAVTLSSGVVASYNIYRANASGGQDYSVPLAAGIATGTASYTDATVTAGNTYYYTIAPVVVGVTTPVTASADTEITILVPPPNMAMIHPWIANQEMCGMMGRAIDRTNGYSCVYAGPGNTAGRFNRSKALMVDTYGQGCNYTHGTDCAGSDCIGTGGAPGAGIGINGDVYYDRSAGNCYGKVAGSWVAANSAGAATLQFMMSNKPGLPPIVNIDQNHSWTACQSLTVAGYTSAERLLKHSEQILAAAWSTSLSDVQISNLENGTNLYSTFACNANSGSGLTYDNLTIPADLNTVSGTLASGIKSIRLGNTATTNCVSRYGIQDMVANVWQWSSDQLNTCSNVSHTCQGATSTLDAGNTDWNGFNFDGTIGPGAGGANVTEWNFSAQSFSSTQFQVALGLPMVAGAPASWDFLAIGAGGGQFNSAKFHGNHFWLYTDNGNGVPARGAFAGGSWSAGTSAGRFALLLYSSPTIPSTSVGFRCALPAN